VAVESLRKILKRKKLINFIYYMINNIIILCVYIVTVFIARYFNMILYKKGVVSSALWVIWFVPLAGPLTYIIIYIAFSSNKNWFTGKNW
jgi:hypothetical protein